MKPSNYLPIITSPRLKNSNPIQSKLVDGIKSEEENYLFKTNNSKSNYHSQKALTPTNIESRMEFFEGLKKVPFLIKKNPEEQSVSIAYLSECDRKGLNPLPIGLARATNSVINIHNYGMGDNYAKAFSKGIKQIKGLEKLNLGSNSLTPRGTTSIIINLAVQPLKELNLKDNQVDSFSISPLISLIQKQSPSLKYLNLENTRLSDHDVVRLCDAISNDRVLSFFGLAKNSLGYIAALAIKKMLLENNYLKKLDLHWNNIKDFGAVYIFEGLCKNDSLKELDFSWNSIGKNKDISNVVKIANCLPKMQGLAHLDLSFNYLKSEECYHLGEGLKKNHEILGLHLLGNEGYIDSQGFIQISTKFAFLEQSHLFHRIFEETKSLKSSIKHKSKCWLCEEWKEMTFYFNAPNSGQVFIHLECDDFEPDLMEFNENCYEISRVVPPGSIKFFFSKSNLPIKSKDYEIYELEHCIKKEVHYSDNTLVPISVYVVNKAAVEGNTCDYNSSFQTPPRKSKYSYVAVKEEMKRIEWNINKSLFKDYRVLDKRLVAECLEFDWNQSRLTNFVKPAEQEELKEILNEHYYQIIETFKYIGSQSGNEYFTIGSNIFTDLLNQANLIDSLYSTSDLGVNWNSVIVPKNKQPYNPGNALVRYEFTELLVRVANDRYVRNKICSTIPQGFSKLLEDNLKYLISLYDSNVWRNQKYFNENTDVILKAHKPILDSIFKLYSGRKSLPGQKPFMSLEEFRQLAVDAKLVPEKLPTRDIDTCFVLAMMVQVDELYEKRHIEMNYVEFLEALCRISSYLEIKNEDTEEIEINQTYDQDDPDITKKIEKAMWNLYQLCPRSLKDNFNFPTQKTYKTFMYKFDRNPTIILDGYNEIE